MTKPFRMDLESLSDRIVPSTTHLFAVGEDIGGTSIVQVYNADGSFNRAISPYGPAFTGGARVVTGDVNGDGTDDIIVAPGPGGGPEIKVFDGTNGNMIRDFFAYDPGFLGGVNIGVGDVNVDGRADIITGVGIGGGPNVKVFDGATGGQIASFFAYESNFRGGVLVAAGDVNGDGAADIITGTGPGGGPRVQVFDAVTNNVIDNFFAYDGGVRSGVTVAAGDLNGDGKAEIVTGVGFGNGPNVKEFDGETAAQLASFYAYGSDFLGGVAVDVVDYNGSNGILTAPGPSTGGYAEVFDPATASPVNYFRPFPTFNGGVTTGQGVATLAAPLSDQFASVAPFKMGPGTGGTATGGSSNDTTGYGTDSSGDVLGGNYSNGSNYIPDTSSYSPPYDPGTSYTPDTSSTSSDSGYSDSGSNDSGYDDGGSYDTGSYDYTDPGDDFYYFE